MSKRSFKEKTFVIGLALLIAAFCALEIVLRPKKEGDKNERPI
jgi:hypothetical protein